MRRLTNSGLCGTLAISLFFTGWAVQGQETGEAEQLIERVREAINRVESVEGMYRTYYSPETPGRYSFAPNGLIPGQVEGPDGLLLHTEFEWSWQAEPYREVIDGRRGYDDGGQFRFPPIQVAYDGATLRVLERETHSGRVGSPYEAWMYFSTLQNPLVLMGHGVGFRPGRDLDTILDGAKLDPSPDGEPHLKVLRSRFDQGNKAYEITAWIDTAHGFLPRRVEVVSLSQRQPVMSRRIVNDDIREVRPGLWMVLRGEETEYYSELVPPPGMTRADLLALPRAQQLELFPRLGLVALPQSFGTQTFILDESTLQVNEPIPRGRFTLEYPEGTSLDDATHDPPLRYEARANRTPEEWGAIIAEAKPRSTRNQTLQERYQAHQERQDALLSQSAPEFPIAEWLNSGPLTWADLEGQVVLLVFWVEGCGPCRSDLPTTRELHQKREELGITVIGIHSSGNDPAAIQRVIEEFDLRYPICIDAPAPVGSMAWGQLYDRYAVNAIPHTVLVDRAGRVAARGPLHEVLPKARALVDRRESP